MATKLNFQLLVLLLAFRSTLGTTENPAGGTSSHALLSSATTELLPSVLAGSLPNVVPTSSVVAPTGPIPPSQAIATPGPATGLPGTPPVPTPVVTETDAHNDPSKVTAWSLCQPPTSFTQSTCGPTLDATAVPTQKVSNTTKDDGPSYGNLVVNNWCNHDLYLWSVGVWYLGGCRDNITGFGTCEEMTMRTLKANGGSFVEPYRLTCFQQYKEVHWYCEDVDKAAGQGVSIKISKDQNINNINQFEYALVKDTARGDTFYRMNYDISMLDCAREDGVTDAGATAEQHEKKVAGCPGYDGGLSVTFSDNNTANCPPIFCDGQKKCDRIYTWDRTRVNESSLACNGPFPGKVDMTLDLCLNKNAEALGAAMGLDNAWRKLATNIPGGFDQQATSTPPRFTANPNQGRDYINPLVPDWMHHSPSTILKASIAAPTANSPSPELSALKRSDENGGSPEPTNLAEDIIPTSSTVSGANNKPDNEQRVSTVHVTRTTILTVRTDEAEVEAGSSTLESYNGRSAIDRLSPLTQELIFTPTTYATATTSILTVTFKDFKKGPQTGICMAGTFKGSCDNNDDCRTGVCDDFAAQGNLPQLYRCQCPPFPRFGAP